MINSDFRKKMVDSWFSYLQSQICNEFEFFEKGRKKFIKRDWNKKNKKEGGGTSFFYRAEVYLKKLELINLLSLANLQKSLDKKY